MIRKALRIMIGHKNKRDQFGIYEFQDENTKKRKMQFKFQDFIRLLIVILVLLIIINIVALAVKYSAKTKAIKLYQKEDYEGAIDLFEEALKPRLPFMEQFDNDVRFYLADSYVNVGKYGDACYQYGMIDLWSEKEVEGLDYLQKVSYGLQLYDWKDYESALPILLNAYEDGYSDLVLYVGSCYGQIGDLENMQIYYNVFLNQNEMNSFMYAQYAAIALNEGKLEEALSYIEKGKVIEDQSNIKELLFDEIVYYEKMKDYNMAFEKAKAFMELYPDDKDGKNEYDLLYTRQTITEK